jgi:hypothetical protein
MIYGFNNYVACEPFKAVAVETKSVGNEVRQLRVIANRETLVPLKVLYGSNDGKVGAGDRLYVTAPAPNEGWAKTVEVQTPDGKVEVVMVPFDKIRLVECSNQPSFSGPGTSISP